MDYDAYLERARAEHNRRQPKIPDKVLEPRPIRPPAKFKCPAGGLVYQGFANLYNVKHEFNGGIDVFDRNCFSGSLYDVMFGVDHRCGRPVLGTQEDGTLELADTEVGLAFR